MDFNNQNKLLKGPNNNDIGEAEDRISRLPDSIVHHILSFIDTKCVARTSVLSIRWNHIWTSIPTLDLSFQDRSKPPSLLKINKFMDFVDTTLHLHDTASSIHNFSLDLESNNMNVSRVRSWIKNLTRLEKLSLHLNQGESFPIPISLFTCASLTKLELSVGPIIHFPKFICFPSLKSLTLIGVQFTDGCWNEQLFSNCPFLEELLLESCTWFGVRNFCILTPALKVLQIENYRFNDDDGLRDCDLKIYAPSLVSLKYLASGAKDYDISFFPTLDIAEVDIFECESTSEQRINHGAAVSKFLRALSHARCLSISARTIQLLSVASDFISKLPTFHNLNELNLLQAPVTNKFIFALLKAAPNLKRVLFDESVLWSSDDMNDYDAFEDLFPNLQYVRFVEFTGEEMEFTWAELILKNALSLQTVTIEYSTRYSAKSKEVVMKELLSFPRASCRCVVKFI